jgi:hypothetical protein
MMAKYLLILRHKRIKVKNCFSTASFDGTGNRTSGGVGCAACHAAPEFDDPIQETMVL